VWRNFEILLLGNNAANSITQ